MKKLNSMVAYCHALAHMCLRNTPLKKPRVLCRKGHDIEDEKSYSIYVRRKQDGMSTYETKVCLICCRERMRRMRARQKVSP